MVTSPPCHPTWGEMLEPQIPACTHSKVAALLAFLDFSACPAPQP